MDCTGSKLTPRVGVASLSSPLEVGADRAPEAAEELARELAASGVDVVLLGSVGDSDAAAGAGRRLAAEHVDAVVFVPVCWFEDYLVLDLLEECAPPVLFRPLPGMETGALCGTQQITCYLKQLDHPYATVFGPLGDAECFRKTLTFLRAAALKGRLRRARIGLGGHRVAGMTHTSPNEFMLKKAVGARVVPLDMTGLLARAGEIPESEAADLWKKVSARAGACEVSEEVGLDSVRLYAAIKEEVARHGLDALSIGCYPHLMGRVCLAASLLADEGIPLACEGDVHGAVGQLMLSLLSGGPTHNTDWLDPLDDGTVVFSHCGSGSFSLAEGPSSVRLASVRLMGRGVCALFTSKPGPVTMLALTPRPDGYQCALLEGEALSTDMVFPGNPVRVRFDRKPSELIEWIATEGIGHHWMIGYGELAGELRRWAKLAGPSLRLIEP